MTTIDVGYTKQTFDVTSASNTYVFTAGVNPNYGLFPPHENLAGVYSKVANVNLTIESQTQGGLSVIQGGVGNGEGNAGIGIDLTASGTVTNSSSGYIIGGSNYNGYSDGKFFMGNGGIGVSMAGGTLTNDEGGVIKGGRLELGGTGTAGAAVSLSGASLENSGRIYGGDGFYVGGAHGTGGNGVDLTAGATLTNSSSGYIGGGFGLYSAGVGVDASGTGASLVNDGQIRGGGIYSDLFHGYTNDSGSGGIGVILSSGATLTNNGDISGGSSADNGPPDVSVAVDSGGTLNNADAGTIGVVTVAVGGAVFNTGRLAEVYINGGSVTTSPSNTVGDTSEISGVYLNGGTLTTSSYIDGGRGGDDIQFGQAAGKLVIDRGATFDDNNLGANIPTIAGFAAGDTVDITYLSPTAVRADYTSSSHTLTLNDSGEGVLAFGGSFTGEVFAFNSDGSGGTDVTLEAACYRRGTRIQADQGEVAIEALKIGDRVMTLADGLLPIRWIGKRTYSGWHAQDNFDVLPVLIRAGALGAALPQRNLWVSPGHAMYIDGMLIAARDLVNGDSIVQEEFVEEVTYFHLEFDTHAVIFAEGAPAESFVDDETREMFDNAEEYRQLYPHAVSKPARYHAPRVPEGWQLERVRRRLAC